MPEQSKQETPAESEKVLSLYEEVVATGLPIDNHYSDLYIKDSPEARNILARYPSQKGNSRMFVVQVGHPDAGQVWWDVPFAYLPYWDQRMREGRAAAEARERVNNEKKEQM